MTMDAPLNERRVDLSKMTNGGECLAIVVDCKHADTTRKILRDANLLDRTKRSQKIEGRSVALPLKEESEKYLLENVTRSFDQQCPDVIWKIQKLTLPPAKGKAIRSQYQVLVDNLKSITESKGTIWTSQLEEDVPGSWERHGNLVLLSDKFFQNTFWDELGDELWKTVTKCLSCTQLAKRGTVSTNGFRSPQVKLLLGEDGWVQQTDNGIKYTYDITKCMFSSGNITEKLRVANFDCKEETVIDLYAGIGYFTLPYLVHTGAKHVYACEWNPDAVEALKRNVKLNSVQDRCTVLSGDNRQMCPKGVADRVNLGLIPSSEPGWRVACLALKPHSGGILHIHDNVESSKNNFKGRKICLDSCEASMACHDAFSDNNAIHLKDDQDLVTNNSGNSGDKHEEKLKSSKNPEPSSCSEIDQFVSTKDKNLESDKVLCKLNLDNDICVSDELTVHNSSESTTVNGKGTNRWTKVKQNIPVEWSDWACDVSQKIKQILNEESGGLQWTTRILHIEHVKSYAPHVDHLVLDLECRPLSSECH